MNALTIITICEVLRVAQNAVQLHALRQDQKRRMDAFADAVHSLRMTDREWVRRMLEE